MLDLALFLFVAAFLAAGIRHPFIWVLVYLYIDILSPQKIGWSLTPALPISLIAFCAAFAGWLLADPKIGSRFTFRQFLMVCLLIYCAVTTANADFPVDAANKWSWVWKAMVFAIFFPLALTTRLRIEGATLIMLLSAAAIYISAGIKTVLAGGGYGSLSVFVNDNSGLYESSVLACMGIAIIPLILWFTRYGTVFLPDWRVKLFGYALIFACLLVPVGTEARTGLVCIAVLAVLLLRDSKRRLTFIAAAALIGTVSLPFLPTSFYDRMSTLTAPQRDESASTRVAVWSWTLEYIQQNPFGGGFDAFRGNKFTYELPVVTESGNTEAVKFEQVTDEGRAYHSAYFEVLGEQGWIGLAIWLLLQFSGLWQMERVRRRWRTRTAPGETWQAPLASALQYAQIIYLVGAIFTGIAYQPLMLMIIGLQIALVTLLKRLKFSATPDGGMSAPARLTAGARHAALQSERVTPPPQVSSPS